MYISLFYPAPPAPQSLQVVNSTGSSIYIKWLPPYPPNGVIKDYRIIYWSEDNEDVQNNIVHEVSEGLGRNIDGLRPYITYHIVVNTLRK